MESALKGPIIAMFSCPLDSRAVTMLERASKREWEAVCHWLDSHGLALYLFKRLRDVDALGALPAPVLLRLERCMEDNRRRTADNLAELERISRTFEREGIRSLHMKGVSLTPEACADPALRLQLDLDFMLEACTAQLCQHTLEGLGYKLTAISGQTWEFKTPSDIVPSVQDLYKAKPERCVEVHLASMADFKKLQSASEWKEVAGVGFPALSPIDRFLGQASHLLKHVRGEWVRLSWVLEFRNSTAYREDDPMFWLRLERCVGKNAHLHTALGAAFALTRSLFRDMPAVPLLVRLEHELERGIHLWIEHYGREAAMADFPGTKLFLLQPWHGRDAVNKRQRLLPLRTPPPVVSSDGPMSFHARLRSLRAQASFLGFRLRFHLREGGRYLVEAPRWRRVLAQAGPQQQR